MRDPIPFLSVDRAQRPGDSEADPSSDTQAADSHSGTETPNTRTPSHGEPALGEPAHTDPASATPDRHDGGEIRPSVSEHAESPARERITAIVRSLARGATYDDILRELAFERMVRRGLDDLATGRVFKTEYLLQAARSWQR